MASQTQCPPFSKYTILESYTHYILSIHSTVIIKVTHYKTHKLIPTMFFTVGTKNEVIISHAANTQVGLLQVICNSRTGQCRHQDAIEHTFQPEQSPTTAHIHPVQDHYTTAPFTRPQQSNNFPLAIPINSNCSLLYKTIKQSTPSKTCRIYSWILSI